MLESDDVVRLLLTKPEVRGSIPFRYFFLLNFFLLYDLNSTKMQVLLACHQCVLSGGAGRSLLLTRIGQSPPLP